MTTINQGTLQIGDGTNFSFGANNNIHLDPDAAKAERPGATSYFSGVTFNTSGQNFDYNGVISGKSSTEGSMNPGTAYAFTKAGAGTMTLFQDQTYTGVTQVTGGTLQIGNGGTTGMIGQGRLNVSSGATVILDRSTDATMPGVVAISGTFIKRNSNTLTLKELFGGTTLNIEGGTMLFQPDKTAIVGTGVSGGAVTTTLAAGTKLIIDADTTGNGQKYEFTWGSTAGTISGAGELIKDGAGTLILEGHAQHTGGTTINAGTFQVGKNTGSFGKITGNVFINEGAELVFSPISDVTADPNGSRINGSDISGGGDLVKGGNPSATTTMTLQGTLAHTGKTEVLTGGLTLAGNARLDDTRALILHNGTTFTATDEEQTLKALEVRGSANYEGNFSTGLMNFYLPSDWITTPGFTSLNVTGTANIAGSTINVLVPSNSESLHPGDRLKLIAATGGVNGSPLYITLNSNSRQIERTVIQLLHGTY